MISWAVLTGSLFLAIQGCAGGDAWRQLTQEETSELEMASQAWPEFETKDTDDGQALREVSRLYYAYHCLDADKQKIYLEMLDALTDLESDAVLSTTDKSVLDQIFACVMGDHPELFYVEGYQYTEYMYGSEVTGITFSGTYAMSKEEADQTRVLIDQKAASCLADIPVDGDDYDTVRALYEWLIGNTEYDPAAGNDRDIRSVFFEGRSVCQGYAKAMQYLLQKADITCLFVTGYTGDERHGWDIVEVNGEFYHLDPTWGDVSYAPSGEDSLSQSAAPSINYDYFLVTSEEIARTHTVEEVVELPACTAVRDNYFVREGLYFETYDPERLAAVFDSEASRASGCVTIKCSSDESYALMMEHLIGQQKIFDHIDRQTASVAYTSDEVQRTISFWNIY